MNAVLSTLTESGDPRRTRRRLIVLLLLAMLGLVSLMLVLGHHMRRHTIAEEFARRNEDIARAYAQDLQLSLELYRARAHALLAKPGPRCCAWSRPNSTHCVPKPRISACCIFMAPITSPCCARTGRSGMATISARSGR